MDFFGVWMVLCLLFALAAASTCGYFTSKIASQKGYSSGAWFAIGFFLSLWGIVIALLISPKPGALPGTGTVKLCSHCGNAAHPNAYICPNCYTPLFSAPVVPSSQPVRHASQHQSDASTSCPNCGGTIADENPRFCPFCGRHLIGQAST